MRSFDDSFPENGMRDVKGGRPGPCRSAIETGNIRCGT